MTREPLEIVVPDPSEGDRLDRFVADSAPELSRSAAQRLIRDGEIRVNGSESQPSQRLRSGDRILIPLLPASPEVPRPEAIPLDIVFEDAEILVVNKPAGMVVHPAAGASSGTLVNALLSHFPALATTGEQSRPGIVHRIDRDTTGLLAVAKTPAAYDGLRAQFSAHSASRTYAALVCGEPPESGTVNAPIGRSAKNPTRFSVGGVSPRHAVTHFALSARFRFSAHGSGVFSLLDVTLETGRTHQIRAHLAHIGFPVVGDPTYGGGYKRAVAEAPPSLKPRFAEARRQMLHALRLALTHPRTGDRVVFEAPFPSDFASLVDRLREASI